MSEGDLLVRRDGAGLFFPGQPGGEPQPLRLQRSRRRQRRTAQNARYVGRPTLFANPFLSERFGHARAVRLHALWLDRCLGALTLERIGFDPGEIDGLFRFRERVLLAIPHLRGLDLECWCPLTSRWCHADTLLRLANG